MYKCYTGVGSRATPTVVLKLMNQIAKKYVTGGWLLRSGGAEGADTAFENGCVIAHGKLEIYIPWDGFGQHYHDSKRVVLVKDQIILDGAERLAAEVHPNWSACSHSVRNLHTRNAFQVLGANLLRPSQALICWAPIQGSSIKGGTRTAWEIAKLYSIPCFNLADPRTQQKFEQFVKS